MDIDGLRNMMFVFKTKSKRNIIQLFNFRSSKANNIEISDVGINLKTGIEKIREQIQNIE